MPPFLLAASPPLCVAATVSEGGVWAVRLQDSHVRWYIPADARRATCHHDRAALHTTIRIHTNGEDSLFYDALIMSTC